MAQIVVIQRQNYKISTITTSFSWHCLLGISPFDLPVSGMTNVYLLALNNAELLAVMLEGYGQRGIYADRYTFMQGLRCACSVLSGGFYFF